MKRQFLIFGLIGLLLTLLSTGIGAATSPLDIMEKQHHDDSPHPTLLLSRSPSQPVTADSVTYGKLDNQPLTGYLAYPQSKETNLPGLIVIHEWWGLNDNIKKMTERMAGEGYIVLAVDLYGNQVANTPQQARELVTIAINNSDRLKQNLSRAYYYLEKTRKSPKIGTIGWCFGGTWSLNTALLFPDQIDATVIYYGGGITTDADTLKPLKMPILGIFGELDRNPSPETVKAFENTLNSLGKTARIYLYPNANHAFANPSGTGYNEIAARDAWKKTTAFLQEYLK